MNHLALKNNWEKQTLGENKRSWWVIILNWNSSRGIQLITLSPRLWRWDLPFLSSTHPLRLTTLFSHFVSYTSLHPSGNLPLYFTRMPLCTSERLEKIVCLKAPLEIKTQITVKELHLPSAWMCRVLNPLRLRCYLQKNLFNSLKTITGICTR